MQHLKKQEEGRQDEEPKITQQQEFCVRIAGLCHDLGIMTEIQQCRCSIAYYC